METLKKEPLVVFFDLKVDRLEKLHFGAVLVFVASSKTLKIIRLLSFRINEASDFAINYPTVYDILNEKVWIGHDTLTSDWPNLRQQCELIGKQPPTPKKIIDTSPFIKSNTKLAQLAVLFGLGKPTGCSYKNCILNRTAIENCGAAMSILDMAEKKEKIHPMICHLMKFNGKDESGMEEDKSPLKSLADSPSSQDQRFGVGSSGEDDVMEELKNQPHLVLFDFKKDKFGMLHFGGSFNCPKTLAATYLEMVFCIQPADPTSKKNHENTLYKFHREVFDILHDKVLFGHDITSDWQRLLDEYKHIGQLSPSPKRLIDTAPFIRSQTKLAKLAVLFGLDKPTVGDYFGRHKYLNAIKKCSDAKKIIYMEMEQDSVPEIHPMICHLMKFQPSPKESHQQKK